MNTKHFHAILAKNELAREIRDGESTSTPGMIEVSAYKLQAALEDIEAYTGEGNQPSIESIINDKKGWL
jgi:hypothetical protein